MFHKEKYKIADSLFHLSLQMAPMPETYYNIGLTKFRLKDTCAFCKNMKYASDMYDTSAIRLYNKRCILKTVKYFDNSKHPDSLFYVEVTKYFCDLAQFPIERVYFIKNKITGEISQYDEPIYDMTNSNDSEAPYSFIDLNKFGTDTPIFVVVEDMPQFPGGNEARIKFLMDNIRYPQTAKDNGVQGTVYSTFQIGADGRISDVRILRGLGNGLDEEAVRVIKLMPKWKPGMQSGKAVRVQFNMPIRFTL